MAVTVVGSVSEIVSPAATSVSFVDGNHTTTADTDLLIACIAIEGNEALESNEVSFDISGTPQVLTLISDTGSTGNNSNTRTLVYGLVSPGEIAAANCRTDVQFSANPIASIWINFSGTLTSSVAAATNEVSKDTAGSGATSVLASGGSSGNALLAWGAAQSSASAPSSVDNSFVERADGVTAATGSDLAYHLSTLLTGLPSAATITWNQTSQNSANLIEIVDSGGAAGGVVQPAMYHYRNHGRLF